MQNIQQQVMYEIQQIPEANLVSLYDIIHYFRLGLIKNTDVRACQKNAIDCTEPDTNRKIRMFGSAKGLIQMSDDFDAPLDDFKEYM